MPVRKFQGQQGLVPEGEGLGFGCVYQEPFRKMRKKLQEETVDFLRDNAPHERLGFMLDPEAGLSRKTREPSGREKLSALQRTLDSFGHKRSKNQRWFHRQFTQSVIRKIFKHEFADNVDALREEFGVDQFKSEVMAITPRRWGKTWAVAMFVAAMASVLPNTEQAIFSTGRRASEKLLQLIYEMLCKLPGMRESVVKKTQETIWLQGPGGPGDTRKISSYPSKVRARARSCLFRARVRINQTRCRADDNRHGGRGRQNAGRFASGKAMHLVSNDVYRHGRNRAPSLPRPPGHAAGAGRVCSGHRRQHVLVLRGVARPLAPRLPRA